MPVTTHSIQDIQQNISTDLKVPTDSTTEVVTEQARTRTISREAKILFDKSIIARPLAVPDSGAIRVKNHEYAYRWCWHPDTHPQGYMLRRTQGFMNATEDDVEVLVGDIVKENGAITNGDLILMKISADRYDAALKWNAKKAITYQNMRGVYQESTSPDVFSDSQPKRASVSNDPFSRNKAVPFIPDNPDAIVNDSIKSGRVNQARQAIESLPHAHKE